MRIKTPVSFPAGFALRSGEALNQQIVDQLNSVTGIVGTMQSRVGVQVPLYKWRAAVANVMAGAGRAKLLFIGDSTVTGAGAGTGGTTRMNGAFARSLPVRTAEALTAKGIPAQSGTVIGGQNTQSLVAYGTYDTRMVLGAQWTLAGGGTLGATFFNFTNGAASTLAFTPTASCDTATIYYYSAAGYGGFTVDVDGGGVLATQATAGANEFGEVTVTFAAGTHTLNINAQNNGSLYILGINTYLSTAPKVDVFSGAWYGAVASTLDGSGAFGPLTAMRYLAPDCTVVNLTINDSNAVTDMTTYMSAMRLIIEAAQESGDVVLMVGPPSDSQSAINGTLNRYVDAVYGLASDYGTGVVDLKSRWVSYANIQATLPYYDTLHPGNLAYADAAQYMANTLNLS